MSASGIELQPGVDASQGALRRTGRTFDLAIVGAGSFHVRDRSGRVFATRSGAFVRDRFNHLVDDRGRMLVGAAGAAIVTDGTVISSDGAIVRRGTVVDRLKLPAGSQVRSGFLEASNVDAIGEMVDVLNAQRSFETAEKVLSGIDQTRERAATQVGLVKS